jgi:hypothetical protein
VDLFDSTPVAIANPRGITGGMIFAIPLITGIYMHRKHRSFEKLMRRKSYLLARLLHFNELDTSFVDGALMFSFSHTYHGVDSLRLEFVTAYFTKGAFDTLACASHIDEFLARFCLAFSN